MLPITKLPVALSLLFLLTTAPPLAAQDAEEEYAQTPTDLAELLGEEGAEEATYEFYLYEDDDNLLWTWKSYVENGRHIVTLRMDTVETPNRNETECTIFTTLEGEFSESYFNHFNGGAAERTRAVRNGDQIRIGHGAVRDMSFFEPRGYSPLTNATPRPWLPLAIAYHLRESHEIFVIRLTSRQFWGNVNTVRVMQFEHVGLEEIETNGVDKVAHVLMVSTVRESGGVIRREDDEDAQSLWYVLDDGTILRMLRDEGDRVRRIDPVTAEEASGLLSTSNDDDESE